MSSSQQRWESVDKTSIPIITLVDRYLSACRSAGMSPKTIRGYKEKLTRYTNMSGGNLGDFSIEVVRNYPASLQKAKKWEGNPFTPTTKETQRLPPSEITAGC